MKDDVICVARYRQVGHGTIGLRAFSNRDMAVCYLWFMAIYGSRFRIKGSRL